MASATLKLIASHSGSMLFLVLGTVAAEESYRHLCFVLLYFVLDSVPHLVLFVFL